jgi:hypothetical protein
MVRATIGGGSADVGALSSALQDLRVISMATTLSSYGSRKSENASSAALYAFQILFLRL